MHSAVWGLACQASVLKTPAHLLQTVMLPAPRGSKHSHGLIIVLKVGPHITMLSCATTQACLLPTGLSQSAPPNPQSDPPNRHVIQVIASRRLHRESDPAVCPALL